MNLCEFYAVFWTLLSNFFELYYLICMSLYEFVRICANLCEFVRICMNLCEFYTREPAGSARSSLARNDYELKF